MLHLFFTIRSLPGAPSLGWSTVLRIDLQPLRDFPDFRRIWTSGLISGFGSMATFVAMPFQMADLTGSYVLVGLLGVAEVIPLIVFGLWGGVIADRHDRRRVLLLTECAAMTLSCVLVVNSLLANPSPTMIFVVAVLFAAVDGLQRPSLDALIPRIVPPEVLPSVGALRSLRGNVAQIAGPAVGGILIAVGGVSSAYVFDVLTFVVSALLILRVSAVPTVRDAIDAPWRELREAMSYVRSRRDIIGTYVVDTAAMVLAFPFALFPFIVREYEAEWALGFLYSSLAVGSLIATATSGWVGRVHHHGRIIMLAALAWGLAIMAAGLVHEVWWVLVFMVVAGMADMVSGLFRSLIWDTTIPDVIRGRMAGLELLSYSVGPQVGQVRSTLTARYTSAQASLVIGGSVCAAAIGGMAPALRELWSFDARTAVRQKVETTIVTR